MEHIVEDFVVVLAPIGRLATQHDKEYNTHGPVIALGCIASLKHLWGNVVRCPESCGHFLARIEHLRCPEIYNLYLRFIILRL